jgi:hypothetical protein
MATANFYNKNASKIFAAEIEEEWDYRDLVDNIQYALEDWSDEDKPSSDREGTVIAEKTLRGAYAGCDVSVTVRAVVRSGYYAGVNVDWEVEYAVGHHSDEEMLEEYYISDEIENYGWTNRGMAVMQAPNVTKFWERSVKALSGELEDKLTEYTTPLVVTARFSNGETMYAHADSLKGKLASV